MSLTGPSYTRMAHGGSDDINAQTMKLLIRDSGLTAPIGASPGEMRLWIKKNGFDQALAAKREGRELPKAAAREPAKATAPPKKTAGHRGGRAGRSGGSVQAAMKVASEPAAGGQDGSLSTIHEHPYSAYTDAIDDFKKNNAMNNASYAHAYAGYGLAPDVGGIGGANAARGNANAAYPYPAAPAPYSAAPAPYSAAPAPYSAAPAPYSAAPAPDPAAYARLYQQQVQMQQAALLQQQQRQWQLLQQLPGGDLNTNVSAAPPPAFNWMAHAYNYQQPRAYFAQQ